MKKEFFLGVVFMACLCVSGTCQKQLVLLKNESVRLRLYPGDEIVFKLKDSKRRRTTYVNNLSDTAVVTHRDTIPFHKIERVYFRQSMFINRLGSILVFGGAAFFLIDQFNAVIIQGNDPSLDDRVSAVALSSVGVGLPIILIRKKSQKLNHKHRLMMVTKDSFFYQPDPRGFQSPFIGN